VGTPKVYWVINKNEMDSFEGFADLEIEHRPSIPHNDTCHRDLTHVGDHSSASYVEAYCKPPNLFVCCDNQSVCLGKDDYENLLGFKC